MRQTIFALLFAASLALAAAPKLKPILKGVEAQPQPATDEAIPASKTVHVTDRDVVAINTRLRFTTMIVLPKDETILDFVCGDKEFWVVNGSQNFAFVKPARENGRTNLNLITAAGNVYSFTLTEVGEGGEHDLKVFIEPKEGLSGGTLNASLNKPRFVATEAVEDFKEQARIAQAEAARAHEDAARAISEADQKRTTEMRMAQAAFPAAMTFDYEYHNQPEFAVTAMYHDGKFTYIKANPQETPALYELKDDKPSLIQFQYADGLYTVPKIIDRGYLSIGKKKMHFTRAVGKKT